MKLISGQSELLFTHNWSENLHLKPLKLKPHTKKLRLAVTVSQIMSLFQKRRENWSKEFWFWIHLKDLPSMKFSKILSWQVIPFQRLFLAAHLLVHPPKTSLIIIKELKLNQSHPKMTLQDNFLRKNPRKNWLQVQWLNQAKKSSNSVAQLTTSNLPNKVWNPLNKLNKD